MTYKISWEPIIDVFHLGDGNHIINVDRLNL